jgi:hypothetical protein
VRSHFLSFVKSLDGGGGGVDAEWSGGDQRGGSAEEGESSSYELHLVELLMVMVAVLFS